MMRTAPGARPRMQHVRSEPPAPRQQADYRCGRGHDFTVTLAAEITPPRAWDCRCGAPGHHVATGAAGGPGSMPAEPGEHERRMAQLLERRSVAELEQMLARRLAELAAPRKITDRQQPGRGTTR